MGKQVEVIIEKPVINMWQLSLKEILDTVPGSHFGLEPVAIVTKYFFDYYVYDDEVEESIAQRTDDLSKKISELLDLKSRSKSGNGIYHWSDSSYNKLAAKVKRSLGKEFVQYIEPKLVMLCNDKLFGSVDEELDLFAELHKQEEK